MESLNDFSSRSILRDKINSSIKQDECSQALYKSFNAKSTDRYKSTTSLSTYKSNKRFANKIERKPANPL